MSNPFAQGPKAHGFTGSEAPTEYWDKYEAPSATQSKGPLPPGRYTLRVPEPGDGFKPGRTGKGAFRLELEPTVVAPAEYAGRLIRFVKLSSEKQPWREGSMAGDLLKAAGLGSQPRTVDDWFKVAPSIGGKLFDADIDLSVYDKESGRTIFKRAADIPTRKDGSLMTVIVLHADGTPVLDCGDADQQRVLEEAALNAGGRKLFANNDIKRIYPPSL
jgi:hypothetical protein